MPHVNVEPRASVGEPDVKNLLRQVKNSVGDLKAEWVLIKRELHNQQSSTSSLSFDLNDVKSDAAKLKKVINDVRSDTSVLKGQQERLDSIADKLMSGVTYIEDTLNARGISVDTTAKLPTRKAAAEMKAKIDELARAVKAMGDHNAAMERQLKTLESGRPGSSEPVGDGWSGKTPDAESEHGGYSTNHRQTAPPKGIQLRITIAGIMSYEISLGDR